MNNEELLVMLQQCSLLELLLILDVLLTREGYGQLEVLDRIRTTQKSKKGGVEILGHIGFGVKPMTCAIKVINDDIRVRMLSELVGTVDRLNADIGVIVSPRKLCASATRELPKYTKVPLIVIDGEKLADLMRKYEYGVRPDGSVDYAFFGGLDQFSLWAENALANMP